MDYHKTKVVDTDFSTAIERVTEELAKEGFGILTEIDVKATLKKKLDLDFRNYMILGACNPNYAIQVLRLEDTGGALLPCNVVVQEHEDGRVEVCVENPLLMNELLNTDELTELFTTVNASIDKVLAAV
jgi:uncharacterized protein (DUF302 family)